MQRQKRKSSLVGFVIKVITVAFLVVAIGVVLLIFFSPSNEESNGVTNETASSENGYSSERVNLLL